MNSSRSNLDTRPPWRVESQPEVKVSEVMERIMSAKDGPAAIGVANLLVEEGKLAPENVAPALRERIMKKVGSVSMDFTVRVAHVWFDYKTSPAMKIAALTWAVTQDLQGSAQKDFQGRLDLANELLGNYPLDPLNKALYKVLSDTYYLGRIADDFRYLTVAVEREIVLPKENKRTTPPSKPNTEFKLPDSTGPTDDVWALARLENIKKRAKQRKQHHQLRRD